MAASRAHLPPPPLRASRIHQLTPSSPPLPPSTPQFHRGSPAGPCPSSRRDDGDGSSTIDGGSGGARDALQRAPPLQALDAHQRVQGNVLHLHAPVRMAASSSCDGINRCRSDHLPPLVLPCVCVGEQFGFSPTSSPARSDASEGAASGTEENEREASAERSTQVLVATAAIGGRGGPLLRDQPDLYLDAHCEMLRGAPHPASPCSCRAAWSATCAVCPVSSKGSDGCRDGGEGGDGGDTSSSITSDQGSRIVQVEGKGWRDGSRALQ